MNRGAHCKYCVTVKAKELGNADQQAITHGILQAVRTRTILTQEACDNVPHIAGKVEIKDQELVMNADIDTLLTDESDIDDGDSNCVAANEPKRNGPSVRPFSHFPT
ncbi:hypothetical protein BDR03DRAFT_1015219 [Suillus americanus]|nr:hypothetical protein BDR03DRAFT_1015219 [Suillus americanus]